MSRLIISGSDRRESHEVYSFCYTVVYTVQSIETSKFHTHAVGKFESNVRTHEITLRIFSAKFQRRQRIFIKYETKELSNFRRKFNGCEISSIFDKIWSNFACVTFEQYCTLSRPTLNKDQLPRQCFFFGQISIF